MAAQITHRCPMCPWAGQPPTDAAGVAYCPRCRSPRLVPYELELQ